MRSGVWCGAFLGRVAGPFVASSCVFVVDVTEAGYAGSEQVEKRAHGVRGANKCDEAMRPLLPLPQNLCQIFPAKPTTIHGQEKTLPTWTALTRGPLTSNAHIHTRTSRRTQTQFSTPPAPGVRLVETRPQVPGWASKAPLPVTRQRNVKDRPFRKDLRDDSLGVLFHTHAPAFGGDEQALLGVERSRDWPCHCPGTTQCTGCKPCCNLTTHASPRLRLAPLPERGGARCG